MLTTSRRTGPASPTQEYADATMVRDPDHERGERARRRRATVRSPASFQNSARRKPSDESERRGGGGGGSSKSNPNTISVSPVNATGHARLSRRTNVRHRLYQPRRTPSRRVPAHDDATTHEHTAVYDDAARRYGGGDEGEEGDDERWGAVRVSNRRRWSVRRPTTLLGECRVATDVHSVRHFLSVAAGVHDVVDANADKAGVRASSTTSRVVLDFLAAVARRNRTPPMLATRAAAGDATVTSQCGRAPRRREVGSTRAVRRRRRDAQRSRRYAGRRGAPPGIAFSALAGGRPGAAATSRPWRGTTRMLRRVRFAITGFNMAMLGIVRATSRSNSSEDAAARASSSSTKPRATCSVADLCCTAHSSPPFVPPRRGARCCGPPVWSAHENWHVVRTNAMQFVRHRRENARGGASAMGVAPANGRRSSAMRDQAVKLKSHPVSADLL